QRRPTFRQFEDGRIIRNSAHDARFGQRLAQAAECVDELVFFRLAACPHAPTPNGIDFLPRKTPAICDAAQKQAIELLNFVLQNLALSVCEGAKRTLGVSMLFGPQGFDVDADFSEKLSEIHLAIKDTNTAR